jgi:tetratricopeptide (TPR) repeat protein
MNDDETIQLACRSLETAVKKYCKRHAKRFRGTDDEFQKLFRQVLHLVNHAQFILQNLITKRQSMQYAVEALQHVWNTSYKEALQTSRLTLVKPIMTLFLQHYLRLADGLVLLISGECRHKADIESNNRFKTHLTQNSLRQDGYTMLYNPKLHYSGYGWDELFDPNFGVQTRLVTKLQKLANLKDNSSIWDTLLDGGAQAFESALTEHEVQMTNLQASLEALRQSVPATLFPLLQTILGRGGSVVFASRDKMESLTIQLPKPVKGMSQLVLQRRGHEFQLAQSVVPNAWDATAWRQQFGLPSKLIATKKRRILVDDDDEDEDGLLHVKETKHKTTSTAVEQEVSLKAIKTDMGVNAQQLESAREALEDEKQPTFNKNDTVDTELRKAIQKGRVAVQRWKGKLKQEEDIVELWDVRDGLRQELMQLGNNLLEYASETSDHLQQATDCFQQAIQVVQEQERAFVKIFPDSKEDGARFRRCNLYLLRGRAHTNCGISLLELSHVTRPHQHREEASKQLEQALEATRTLQDKCVSLTSTSESALYKVEACQLQALAGRTFGAVLWHQGKAKQAVQAFETASRTFETVGDAIQYVEKAEKDTNFANEYLNNLLECLEAALCLYDHVDTKLERLKKTSADSTKGEELLSFAGRAVERAKEILTAIKKLMPLNGLSFEGLCKKRGIRSPTEIDEALSSLRTLWKERRSDINLNRDSFKTPRELPRSELGIGLRLGGLLSKSRYLVSDPVRRAPHNREAARDNDFDYNPFYNDDEASKRQTPMTYMKWGDELLPQSINQSGESVPVLSYPGCAPRLPEDFQAQ